MITIVPLQHVRGFSGLWTAPWPALQLHVELCSLLITLDSLPPECGLHKLRRAPGKLVCT